MFKKFKEKYENKIKKRNRVIKKTIDKKWIIQVFTISFVLTMVLSGSSSAILKNVNVLVGTLLVIFFIVVGVVFDMIGIAVASADQKPFHSMATKQVKGSKMAIKLIKNAEKVSSFCNDVIGDVCNIISGSVGAVVILSIATTNNFDPIVASLLGTSIIAALTIGGKAMGKSYAINKSELIIYEFAKVLKFFSSEKKQSKVRSI